MALHLKRGMDATAIKAADAKVRETVEKILADIDARKDAAVRDLSHQFDNWSPPSFKLAVDEIERAIGQVRKRDLDDIKFAQAQVRNFAQKQKETLSDLEVETLPGVVLGHRHIPVNSIGCYVPGGRYPMVASAHMSIVTARVARAYDHVDTANGLGAERHGGDRLHAAEHKNFVSAAKMHGRDNRRVRAALEWWRASNNVFHAGNARGDDRHMRRSNHRIAPAGHIAAD